jgi:plasmid stabilization system protein ParE
MGDIKSAREIAMEKLAQIEEPTDEERLRWKFVPRGKELAARHLKEDCNLVAELSRYQENEKKYIADGAAEIFISNIDLPRNDIVKRNNRRAMEGLKLLKNDKASVENVYSQIRNIFKHYAEQGEQQRRQAYESLKAQFEARIQQAVQQQLGPMARARIDVEKQPQFHEEWRRMRAQLDSQYLHHLAEYKRELSSLP